VLLARSVGVGRMSEHRDVEVALEAALERERDLYQALLEGSYFHVAHDGRVRHRDTCNDCRALAERSTSARDTRTPA
jgi:hypothetical protein